MDKKIVTHSQKAVEEVEQNDGDDEDNNATVRNHASQCVDPTCPSE